MVHNESTMVAPGAAELTLNFSAPPSSVQPALGSLFVNTQSCVGALESVAARPTGLDTVVIVASGRLHTAARFVQPPAGGAANSKILPRSGWSKTA